MLSDLLRGRQSGAFDRAIDVAVGRLRRKLEQDLPQGDGAPLQIIKTMRSGGYVLAATVSEVPGSLTPPETIREPRDARQQNFRSASLFQWLVPKSLKARTNLLLFFGIACVQSVSFAIYALGRFWLTDRAVMQESKHRALSIYQVIMSMPISERAQAVADLRLPPGFSVKLANGPDEEFSASLPSQNLYLLPVTASRKSVRLFTKNSVKDPDHPHAGKDYISSPQVFFIQDHHDTSVESLVEGHDLLGLMMLEGDKRPRAVVFERRRRSHLFSMSMRCSDEDRWLIVRFHVPPPNPFGSWSFLRPC